MNCITCIAVAHSLSVTPVTCLHLPSSVPPSLPPSLPPSGPHSSLPLSACLLSCLPACLPFPSLPFLPCSPLPVCRSIGLRCVRSKGRGSVPGPRAWGKKGGGWPAPPTANYRPPSTRHQATMGHFGEGHTKGPQPNGWAGWGRESSNSKGGKGKTRKARRGKARRGKDKARRGEARQGKARQGEARRGEARRDNPS